VNGPDGDAAQRPCKCTMRIYEGADLSVMIVLLHYEAEQAKHLCS
jgi:hypothetical protein